MITVQQYFKQLLQTDKFKPCHRHVLIDLKDFLNMRKMQLRTVFQWENIKHNHVLDSGRTIWSITEDYWRQYFNNVPPIGQEQPSTELIQFIYDHLSVLPTFSTPKQWMKLSN